MDNGRQEALHQGHRTRIRERFFSEGLDLFDDNMTLELLLFYCIPRKDTNDIAHMFLEKLGGLSGVLDADPEELQSLGLPEKGAELIRFCHDIISSVYLFHKKTNGARLTTDNIGDFFAHRYVGVDNDETCLLLLDSDCCELYCEPFKNGTINTDEEAESLARLAVMYGASGVILAKNKPGGAPMPDAADITAAEILGACLRKTELSLIDYLIIADGDYFSMGDSEYKSLFL